MFAFGYLIYVNIFFCSCTFIPLLLEWDFDLEGYEIGDMPILHSISTQELYTSIIASLAVSLPILIDFVLDLLFPQKYSKSDKGNMSKLFLILSLILPDLIILIAVIPYKNIGLLACCFECRWILGILGTYGHLWEFGQPIFNTTSVAMVTFPMSLHNVFNAALSFETNHRDILKFTSYSLLTLSLCTYLYFCIQWYKSMRVIMVKDISTSQISCFVYVLTSWTVLIAYYGLTGIEVPIRAETTSEYLTVISYLAAVFSVSLSVLQGRLRAYEVTIAQEKIQQLKSSFIRYISHEVRNPLNAVVLGMDVIDKEMRQDKCSEDAILTISEIRESCELAQGVLNMMLDFERIEDGMMQLDRVQVTAWSIVDMAMKPLVKQAQIMDIQLSSPLDCVQMRSTLKDTILLVDQQQLTLVLQTLVTDVLKHTCTGGRVSVVTEVVQGTVKNKYCVSKEMKSLLRVAVTNIHTVSVKMKSKRVFQGGRALLPKSRKRAKFLSDNDTIANQPFDFNNAKHLIELHDGSIYFGYKNSHIRERNSGEHSDLSTLENNDVYSFIVMLPIHRIQKTHTLLLNGDSMSKILRRRSSDALNRMSISSDVGELERRVSLFGYDINLPRMGSMSNNANLQRVCAAAVDVVASQSNVIRHEESFTTNPMPEHSPPRVLLVDDVPMNRKMLRRVLKDVYPDITEAVDGVDAVEKVHSVRLDQTSFEVILMDFQMPNMDGPTATKTLRAAGYKGVIIGVTGNAMPEDVETFLASGADKVLLKPVNEAKISATIQEVKSRNKSISSSQMVNT